MYSDREQHEYEEVECCVTSCVGSDRMAKSKGFKWTMTILHVIAFILGSITIATAVLSTTLDDPPSNLNCTGNITGSIDKTEIELPIFLATWAAYFTYLSVNFAGLWVAHQICCWLPLWTALWFLITIGEIVAVVILGIDYLTEIFPVWREDTSACSHLIVVLSVFIVIAIAVYGTIYATIAVIGVTCNIVHKRNEK